MDLKRMCTLLLLGRVFCKHVLTTHFMCFQVSSFLLELCLDILSTTESFQLILLNCYLSLETTYRRHNGVLYFRM